MQRILFFILFTSQFALSQGLLPVNPGDKWGYINLEGEMVIEPQFSFAGTFHDARAVVRDSGYYYFIDTTGEQIGELKFELVTYADRRGASVQWNGRNFQLSWNEIESISERELLDTSHTLELFRRSEPEYKELGHGLRLVTYHDRPNELLNVSDSVLLSNVSIGFITDSVIGVRKSILDSNFLILEGKILLRSHIPRNWFRDFMWRSRPLEQGMYPLSYEEMMYFRMDDSISYQSDYYRKKYCFVLDEAYCPMFIKPMNFRILRFGSWEYSAVKLANGWYDEWSDLNQCQVGIIHENGSMNWLSSDYENIRQHGKYFSVRTEDSLDPLNGAWILVDSLGNGIVDTSFEYSEGVEVIGVQRGPFGLELGTISGKYFTRDKYGYRNYNSDLVQLAYVFRDSIPSNPGASWSVESERIRKSNFNAKILVGLVDLDFSRVGITLERNSEMVTDLEFVENNSPFGSRRSYRRNVDRALPTYQLQNDSDFIYFFESHKVLYLNNDDYLWAKLLNQEYEVVFVNYSDGWGYINSNGDRIGFNLHNSSFRGQGSLYPSRFQPYFGQGVVEVQSYQYDEYEPYYSISLFRPTEVQVILDEYDSLWELTIINDIGSDVRSLVLEIQVYHQGEWRRVGGWNALRLENHHKYPVGYVPTDLGDIQSTMRLVLTYEYDRDGEVVNGESISEEVPCTYNAYHVSKANR